jgi:Holliday junction resolvase
MSESDLERKVVEYCRLKGMLCYKFSSPARRGVPDRIILYKGRVLFLELKAMGQTPTKLQLREIEMLSKAGFAATWVADFISAKECIDRLREIDEV